MIPRDRGYPLKRERRPGRVTAHLENSSNPDLNNPSSRSAQDRGRLGPVALRVARNFLAPRRRGFGR